MLAEVRVDLAAIRANCAALAALVAPARVAAVVKGNAYGHGLVPVARAIANDVDRLCVYEVAEAVALREAGVAARIHILGPVAASDLPAAYAAHAELTLWDRGAYLAAVREIARGGGAPFAAHVKIDTGVTRLGLSILDAPQHLARYAEMPELQLAGIFSHLAAAEELDSSYTTYQLDGFLRATSGVPSGIDRHIAASAAAMLWPQTRLDSIRAGIAIYGIWPSDETAGIMRKRGLTLVPALSWRTQVVAVHDVPAGTFVGYGCTFRTERDSRIGILPIGYAEGVPRAASNRAHALVNGRRVPFVGRVCMNMAFVDLTEVPKAIPGSVVTLIGQDGDAWIDANEAAAFSETIGYELVTRIPSHAPRTYSS